MIRRSHKPAALRDTWTLPPDDGSRGRLMRRLRRLAAVLFLLLLAAGFTYLLLVPFWHPTLHPLVMTNGAYDGFRLPSFPYALEDAEAIREPLGPGTADSPSQSVHVLRSPSDLQQLEATLAGLPSGRRDVHVLYVAAHGVVLDGKPYLLCQDFDPANPDEGRYLMSALLDRLAKSSAGAKLLILDAGRLDYDPRLGVIVNEFPHLLQRAIRETPDSRLWVLASHSPLDIPLTMHVKRQSAFGRFVAEGLRGSADSNRDGLLDLGELYGYVRAQLGRFAHDSTGGRRTQAPLLLRGGTGQPDFKEAPLLRAVGGLDLVAMAATEAKKKDGASGKGNADKNNAPADSPQKAAAAQNEGTNSVKSGPTSEPTAEDAKPGDSETSDESAKPASGVRNKIDAVESPAARSTPSSSPQPPVTRTIEVPPVATSATDMLAAARRAEALLRQRDSRREPNPLAVAAPAWKAWRERLRAFDETLRAGSKVDPADIARAIRRDLTVLAGLPPSDPTETPSPLLVGLAALQSSTPIPAAQLPTWALAERAQQWGGSVAPPDVSTLIAKLDKLLDADDEEALRELAKQAWPVDADRYAELRFARRLLHTPGLTPALRRAAWRCRRQAETVAADPFATVAWIRQPIALADSHRLAGERALHDQLGTQWRAAALARFERATSEYSAAERALADVHAALQTRDLLLDRVSNYLRWFHAAAGDRAAGPAYEDLAQLLEQLEGLSQVIEQLDESDLTKLVNQHDQLRLTRKRIESMLQPAELMTWLNAPAPGNERGWRADVLLASGLVPEDFESRLWELVRGARFDEKLPKNNRAATSVQPKIITADDWQQAARQLGLELRWARLALPAQSRGELEQLEAIISREAPEIVRGAVPGPLHGSTDELWAMWRESGAALARIRDGIAGRVTTTLEQDGEQRDGERRVQSLRRLREVERIVRLIDARDVGRLGRTDVAARVRRAAWYDLLVWHRERALAALSDAPPEEADEALAQAVLCRRLAQDLPDEPPITDQLPPLPAVDGTTELPLVTQSQRELPLRLRPSPGDNGPVWLVLAFDPELIDVSVADVPAYLEHEVAGKLGAATGSTADAAGVATADYPIRPAAAGLAPSWQITAGAPRELRLIVRRKVAAGRSARLIVKFIGEHFAIRHEANVLMSTLDALELVPSGFAGSWSRQESLLWLHPLPNQRTDYRFALVNHGEADKTVDVEMVALRRPLSSPSVLSLPVSDALDAIGPTDLIAQISRLKLPANGEPVPLLPPPPDAAAQTKASTVPVRSDRLGIRLGGGTEAGVNGGGADDAPQPPDAAALSAANLPPLEGQRMNHGLLLVVRDQETKQTLFRRIEFRPLHPRAFLSVNVGYDPASQRIEVIVKPRDRTLIPAAGLKIRCETPEPLPAGTEARLEGSLAGPQFETRLYLRVSDEESRVQSLAISVGGYPRAFFYRVPSGVASANLPEADDVLEVRVLAPSSGTWFKAPVDTIPVRVQVDAPRGSFANGRDLIEIGLDADRDREFRGEMAIPFVSDRQSEVATKGFEGPVLGVETRIGDFEFNLPTGGLQNVRANVLGRASVGTKVSWSAPVEVILDGTPPVVRRAQVSLDKPAAVGGEIEVIVSAVDGQMSGVDKVEVGLDPPFAGKFGAELPPVLASPSDPTVWKAKLQLQGIEAGLAQILVRATDKAGNASDYTKIPVTVLSKDAADPTKSAIPGRVVGSVTYGERPIPGAEVTLEGDFDAKTKKRKAIASVPADAQGRFAIPNVPPGKYTVRVRGLANNRTRLGSQEVIVVSPPAETPTVAIKAK